MSEKETKVEEKGTGFIKVNREKFLNKLELLQPGISAKGIVQQSNCFIFDKGRIVTYNEEIACQVPAKFGSIRGAFQADPLLRILRKIPDEELNLELKGKNLVIYGKGRETGIAAESEILLPIHKLDTPESWKPIHKDFTDAIGIVQECASKDQSAFTFTCVHINPEYMEACDNLQLARYKIKTGVTRPCLVRRDSIKHIPSFDFTEFSETSKYIHFRNKDGLMFSCRRYSEKFEDFTQYLKEVGTPTVLPKALGEAADRCEEFSSENSDDNLIFIKLRPGRVRVEGVSASGYHYENKKLKYTGKALNFRISPKLLIEFLKRHTDCSISKKGRLIVDGGKFKYVVWLDLQ